MTQSNLYIAKEYLPRTLRGHRLPHWLFPKKQYSLIQESDGDFDVNRFGNIGDLAKFWLNGINDKSCGDGLSFSELPEKYAKGRLIKLSDKEIVYFSVYVFRGAGPEIWVP